jgi:hypothetical protein
MRAAKWPPLHSRTSVFIPAGVWFVQFGSREPEAPASVDHRNKKVRLDDRADRTPEERRSGVIGRSLVDPRLRNGLKTSRRGALRGVALVES